MMQYAMLLRTACAVTALAWMPVAATAQSGPPNALQGFSQNKDKPVQIEAASLEVRDKDKVATFSGAVAATSIHAKAVTAHAVRRSIAYCIIAQPPASPVLSAARD